MNQLSNQLPSLEELAKNWSKDCAHRVIWLKNVYKSGGMPGFIHIADD